MDSIANGGGCRPCKQVQLNVTDAIIHFIGDGSSLSHLNASNVDFGTLTTAVFPASGVTAGTYGSSSNVSQVTIDQYGRVTSASNVTISGGGSSQWTGNKGSPIYYIPGVGIGSSSPATANLQVTGNVYVSNALTTPNVNVTDTINVTGALTANAANATFMFDTFTIPYINTQYLNVASTTIMTGNLVTSNAITTTNLFANTLTLSGTTGQTTLNVTGNIYASNALTTTNVFATTYYGDGGLLSNIAAQWTGNKGSPIYYIPGVGIGSSSPATANLQVTGNVYVSNALTTTNVFANAVTTSNIVYSLDVLAQGPYLNPSTANASIITQWYSRLVNTTSRPFWSVSATPQAVQIPTSNVIGFTSPTLLSDGRVLFIANSQSYVGVFNPNTNQFSYVSGIAIAAFEYSGGIQIPDGRVVLVPSNGNKVGLLNPTSWALSTVSTATSLNNMHYGAVYEPTGNVIMTPTNSSNVGIFNTNTGTYSRVAFATDGVFPIYHGSVLLPDGRVVFIPNSTSNVGIYTPSTATYSNVTVTVNGKYTGGCLMPDGNVFMVPNLASSNACIYNPNLNTLSNVVGLSGSVGGGGGGFGGCVALPDGRIAVLQALNNSGTGFPIYNYKTGTVSTYTGLSMYQNTQLPGGATLVPDGRIVFSTALGIGIANFQTPAPREFCLHPFFNKF